MIKEFYINGLFGERNIRIPFDSNYKIIVSENGCGKTTVLNSLYALLSGNISKLRKVNFSKIGIIFNDGVDISFDKSEFERSLEFINRNPFFEHLESKLGQEFIFQLINETRNSPPHRMERSQLFKRASDILDIPSEVLQDMLRESKLTSRIHNKQINTKAQDKLNKIKKKFSLETLCLPTYRRVEEDIRAFSSISSVESFRHSSINFGMSDVKKSIDKITSEILSSSIEWFSKINGQMLSQLVNGFEVTDEMRKSISSPRSVEIVLERIGQNIPEPQKQQILTLVGSGEILKEHDPLVYFVANLLKVYEQQQENDNAIQLFTSVSNKYLGDKEIIYDESNVTVKIVRKKSGKILDLEYLSSGEKQIISLFSLLYLQKKHDVAIFFDEPELSLSMEWQQTLLPDIIKSERCKFLFCATHSPFIFENELQKNTVDLNKYIEEL
jgi:predicted ATPase